LLTARCMAAIIQESIFKTTNSERIGSVRL
jgi:hypothetical protein